MIPLHVPEPLKGARIAQPLWFKYQDGSGSVLFNKHLPRSFFEYGVEFVEAEMAQAIVLPESFGEANMADAPRIQKYADLGEKLGIPVFIFCLGDLTDGMRFDPRVYVFRQSVYRSTMQPQDIVMPTLTEDNAKEGIVVHQKQTLPLVSFCGQGDYQTFKQQLKYHYKVWRWRLAGMARPILRARIIGVYWRKAMMQACESSKLVATNFIVRKSFSGAHRTIELDPAQARREYLDSIVNSDFVLAPKGDGNYSNRFLKTLCLGRVPVLPDTDVVLPLEGHIEYEKIMVRVPMNKIKDTPALVRQWYDKLSDTEWEDVQRQAREVFETRLRVDSFFEYFFTSVVPTLPSLPASAKKAA